MVTITLAWHSIIFFAVIIFIILMIGKSIREDDPIAQMIYMPFWILVGLLIILIYGGIFWW